MVRTPLKLAIDPSAANRLSATTRPYERISTQYAREGGAVNWTWHSIESGTAPVSAFQE
jgi:hypothetical protein